MPKISVIIPVVNEAELLPKLLDYLCLCDPKKEIEIIVVDGKSTDNSPEIAESCGVKLVKSDVRCRANQMNLGAKAAKSKLLYFVHADVRPPKEFVTQIIEAHENGAKMGFYRQKFDKMTPLLAVNSFFTRFKKIWCRGGDQTLFVTKALFQELNGYDESYTIMEEYDFMTRAMKITDYEILDGDTIVSSRKYTTNSWLKVMLANRKAIRSFQKGLSPKEIREKYINSLNPY